MQKLTELVLICLLFFTTVAQAEVDTSRAVIHHSASSDVSASTINQWHKQRGWDGIGYHFVIRSNGTIEKGRPLTKVGAHAKGRNHYIGICLTGYNTFTKAQIKSLITLLNDLDVKQIERHHEECPGKGLDLNYIRTHITPIKPMTGIASYYTDKVTANGEVFDKDSFSCATLTGNYGMKFKVTNIKTGKWIVVRNNDHGPHKSGRIIDLTPNAFKQLTNLTNGLVQVRIEYIGGVK